MYSYLHTAIDGNKNFGGYLSVDDEKAFAIVDEMIYELAPGQHSLVIYSTSNTERNIGKLQDTINKNTSSSGVILDTLEERSAFKNLGDRWEIDVMVEDGQMLDLNILSKGTKIVGNPMYRITTLSEEQREKLAKDFEEWKNTPIRSKKGMIWGVILAFCGVVGVSNVLKESPLDITGLAVTAGLALVGVLVFVLGFQKKIRRK